MFYSTFPCLLNDATLQSCPNHHVIKLEYCWWSKYAPSSSFHATLGCSSFALGPSQRSSSHVLPSSYVRLSGYQHLLHALFYMRSRCPVLRTSVYDRTDPPTDKFQNSLRATIGMHLTVAILYLFPAVMPSYSACQLALLSCTYHSIITCRVYRLLKVETLGSRGCISNLSDSSADSPSSMTSIVFNDP